MLQLRSWICPLDVTFRIKWRNTKQLFNDCGEEAIRESISGEIPQKVNNEELTRKVFFSKVYKST